MESIHEMKAHPQGFYNSPYTFQGRENTENNALFENGKRTRRGGKKRRGGVAHRRRQQAWLARNAAANSDDNQPQFERQFPQSANEGRPSRSIKKNPQIKMGVEMNNVPMTPSLAALTPRTRSLTIGQILLARALVSEVTGGKIQAPLSRKELEGAPTPRRKVSSDDEYNLSPRTVSALPRSPPLQPQPQPPPPPPPASLVAPSPKSAKKLSKEEFQALVNARVNRSISQRRCAPVVVKPSAPKKLDRFSTVYRTPGGQTISFKQTGKNTPPTPKFGGEKVAAAVGVEWSAYEAVHEPQEGTDTSDPTWRVVPAHAERDKPNEKMWAPGNSNPWSFSAQSTKDYLSQMSFEEFELGQHDVTHEEQSEESEEFDIKFGFGFD